MSTSAKAVANVPEDPLIPENYEKTDLDELCLWLYDIYEESIT
ncbi:MAG TPA: hypothetical protein VMR34_05550 [Candidatus Saccharimonadales bacterium]|nr:hypothetical protein [Candidatus Saccharimonadales bacterium]